MTELEAFQAMLDRWGKEANKALWHNAGYEVDHSYQTTTIRVDGTAWAFDASSGKLIGMYNARL